MRIDYIEGPASDEVLGWFKGHGWEADASAILPPRHVVVFYEDEAVAAMWIYISDCGKTAIAGWPVTDPDADTMIAGIALLKAFEGIKDTACLAGVSILSSYASNPGLLKILERMGFVAGDEGVTHMILNTGV